jgi:hypothetical protein
MTRIDGALPAVVITPQIWAIALAMRLQVPVSPENVHAIVAWIGWEGGHWQNAAKYNPLNTTRRYGTSHAWGGAIPIQVYSSWGEGLEATALTLSQPNMAAIMAALRRSAPPEDTLSAVKRSPWGTTAIDPATWPQLVRSWSDRPAPP